jgi:hypothetical protein
MERSFRQLSFINNLAELMTQVIRVYRDAIIGGEDVIGLLSGWPGLEPHLNLSSLHRP